MLFLVMNFYRREIKSASDVTQLDLIFCSFNHDMLKVCCCNKRSVSRACLRLWVNQRLVCGPRTVICVTATNSMPLRTHTSLTSHVVHYECVAGYAINTDKCANDILYHE